MNILYQYPLLSYALRMVLISAACFGYYQVFLRNRAFHTYNRTYLLASTLLALLLPLVRIPMSGLHSYVTNPVILTLTTSPSNPVQPAGALPSTSQAGLLAPALYTLITGLLLTRLARSIYQVVRLARQSPSTRLGSIRIFQSSGAGVPFSFLNCLFWDPQLDLSKGQGRLIFLHESHHIRHRHTLDILALEVVKAGCWFNPFFHWTQKELKTLHEFAADRSALSENTAAGEQFNYAELLVWRSIEKNIPITHSFFHNQLKRRITMITHTSHRPAGPLTRIMALPLLLLLTALFATTPARTQPADTTVTYKLMRYYIKHLRYPEEAAMANKKATVWFSIQMGEKGNFLGFTPYDHKPDKQLLNISVRERISDAKPDGKMSDEEALKLFQTESQRTSESINRLLTTTQYLSSVPAGEYYFEISFAVEQ